MRGSQPLALRFLQVVNKFLNDPVHAAMAECAKMRPAVDISLDASMIGVGNARTEYYS